MTRLRLQSFGIGLDDQSQAGTPIHRNVMLRKESAFKGA